MGKSKKLKLYYFIQRSDSGLFYSPLFAAGREWPVWSQKGRSYTKKEANKLIKAAKSPKGKKSVSLHLVVSLENYVASNSVIFKAPYNFGVCDRDV